MRPRLLPWLLLPFTLLFPGMLFAQLQLAGEIGGQIRTAKGDPPPPPDYGGTALARGRCH